MNIKVRNVLFSISSTYFTRRVLCSSLCRETSFENAFGRHFQSPTQEEKSSKFEQELQTKLLKIAMVGRPNAGKSTLINQLMGRKVCPISCKQHTTKIKARCVQTEDLTQLVYLDTPGLVTEDEFRRFHLDENFKLAVRDSLKEADVIGVVHDAFNVYTRHHLDPIILDLLKTFKSKTSLLVMNKVDLLKKKKHLIYMTNALTKGIPEHERIDNQKGSWPHFEEVFYVSAETGDGVGDIKAYLMMKARPDKWLFKPETSTDLPLPKLIVNTLEASMLDALAYEIPRLLKISLKHLERGEDGAVYAALTVRPANARHCAIIVGGKGMTLRKICTIAERNLASAIRAPAHLKISIIGKEDE